MNKSAELANESDLSDEDFCPDNEAASELSEVSSDDEIEDDDDNTPAAATKATKKAGKSSKKKSKATNTKQNDKETQRITRQKAEAEAKVPPEKDELESDDDEKERADALWADFLGDVKQTTTTTTTTELKAQKTSTKKSESPTRNHNKTCKKSIDTPNGKHIEDLEESKIVAEPPKQVTITEILDFAGEEIQVQKVVSAESIKENKTAAAGKLLNTSSTSSASSKTTIGLKRPAAAAAGSSGLGSILNQIGKKKKISVLEKTKLDWNSFKKDEGIEEELQTFNKGKDGFLERQDFLQRTDVRQFEIEKNLRQTRRNH